MSSEKTLTEQVSELKANLAKARKRVDWGDDGATHEEMADGYEAAFDWAEDVAERAIKLLEETDKKQASQGYTTMDEVVSDLMQLCNSLPIDPSECYTENDWQSRAIPLVARLLYHGRRYLEAADREHARVQQHLSELINEASDGGHGDE